MNLKCNFILSILSLIIFNLSSVAQTWTQQGSDIDGEATSDLSGWSVSLSSDGSTVAIGAPGNDGNGNSSGHVRIYKNISGTWTQQGSDIDGEAPDDQSGSSVSLSSDGSIVAIGASRNDDNWTDAGHVRIYKNISGTWTQQGSDIDGEFGGDYSGGSVSLSSDGSTVAIGAGGNKGNGANAGHVRIYKNISGTWTQQGSDIDGEAGDDGSGSSVSLSSDGSIVAIGASRNDGNGTDAGHVRIYKNISGTWTQQGSDIDGEAADDLSGWSVSLSSDGSTVAIGASRNDGNGTDAGHVRIYKNISGTWTQQGSDIDGEAANDGSGSSVSLSSDGSIVAIGAVYNDGNGNRSGHVRIYKNISGTWTQQGSDIDGEAGDDGSGSSVSLSSDGSIVAIGASRNDGNGTKAGHVRVYLSCTTDTLSETITACNSYTWTNGVTYTSSNNTAMDTFTNTAGCDSIITLNLTIINSDDIISQDPTNKNISPGNDVTFTVAAILGANATYQWQRDNGTGFQNLSNADQYSGTITDILTITNISTSNANEVYRCIVTSNSCKDTSGNAVLTIDRVSVPNLFVFEDFSVYPNPSNGIVSIESKSSLFGSSYKVYSIKGVELLSGSITSKITTLNIQDLAEGVYLIRVGNDSKQTCKIIKQ